MTIESSPVSFVMNIDNEAPDPAIYICSNVGIDYFFFLQRTIEAAGYQVTPICYVSEQGYRSLAKKHGLKKIWLRAQMYILYPLSLILRSAFKKGNNIFIVTSNTFYAPTILRLFTNPKRVKVIHLLYDLYPDAMEVAWTMKPGSFSSKLIGKIARKNQRSDATVYLGDFLKEHAEKRWGKPAVSKVIDIATDLALYNENFEQIGSENKIVIHSGGQLGYLHDVNSMVECIKRRVQNRGFFQMAITIAEKELHNYF